MYSLVEGEKFERNDNEIDPYCLLLNIMECVIKYFEFYGMAYIFLFVLIYVSKMFLEL